jgi:hypothetical protein
MVIDFPGFASMNRLSDFPRGRYTVVESIYDSARFPDHQAILSELVPAGGNAVIGADLQLLLDDGTVLFRDFQRLPDGGWRDSYGAKAGSLDGLLPPELSDFTLRQRHGMPVEHDGMGRIVPVSPAEANHGS